MLLPYRRSLTIQRLPRTLEATASPPPHGCIWAATHRKSTTSGMCSTRSRKTLTLENVTASPCVCSCVLFADLRSSNMCSITYYVPAGFILEPATTMVPSLVGNRTPFIITLRFRPSAITLPTSLRVAVTAAYLTANDEPRTASVSNMAEMSLFSSL